MAEHLSEVTKLPRDTYFFFLNSFTKCSATKFFGPFESMFNTERFIQLENDGGRYDNSKFLERG